MGRLFGTDGVRGVAGLDSTGRLAMDVAAAAAELLRESPRPGRPRPLAVVGRDPRASGEFLAPAVISGLAGAGMDVLRLGVLPTPGVAWLTDALDADLGVMLSASHNPAPDNGIKLFGRGGMKLPDETEDAIEARLADPAARAPGPPPGGFGRVRDGREHLHRYVEHLLGSLPAAGPGTQGGRPLAGIRVVVDCAHGAASGVAPEVFRRAGADVIAIGAEPDGLNINDGCGSTHLETLSAAVVDHGADAGIAHDGDADRCLAVDAAGQVVDGDQILAVLALSLSRAGQLTRDTVVTTVMSNLGFRLAMREAGIALVETAVGDRYVLEAMLAGQYALGGEQSGHIIMAEHAATGDGLLTGLHLLAIAAREGVPLASLAKVMTRYPQVLVNVTGVDKAQVSGSPEVAAQIAAAEAELGSSGRVLVRPSGTEPAVRVMVEAMDPGHAERLARRLAHAIRATS